MDPLVIEEVLPSNPEEQSPPLIKDLLCDLVPQVGTDETHKVEKEKEGSSSIPGDKDIEKDNVKRSVIAQTN